MGRRGIWLVLVALSTAVGCGDSEQDGTDTGGGGSGGGSGTSSGGAGGALGSGTPSGVVDPETPLAEVTAADFAAICMAHETAIEALENPAYDCTERALHDDQITDVAGCEESVSSCVAQRSTQAKDSACNGGGLPELGDCDVAVGALERCFSDIADFLRGLSCDQVGSPPDPPACVTALEADCPGLVAGGGDDGNGGSGGGGGGGGAGGDGGSGGADAQCDPRGACQACIDENAGSDGPCAAEHAACQVDITCPDELGCLLGCDVCDFDCNDGCFSDGPPTDAVTDVGVCLFCEVCGDVCTDLGPECAPP